MTLRSSSGNSSAYSCNCYRKKTANFLAASNSELLVFVVTTRCDIDYSTLISQVCSVDIRLQTGRRHISSTLFETLDAALVGNVRNDLSSISSQFVCCVWIVDINLDFLLAPWIKITWV